MSVSEFDATTAAQVDAILDHLNANHADTVLLVARHLAGADLLDAELQAVDPRTARFQVLGPDGPGETLLAFATPVLEAGQLQGELLGTLAAARAAVGDRLPLTSLEAELAVTATLRTVRGQVVRTARLTPNVVEVTVGGLEGHHFGGGDEFVYVMVSAEGLPEGWSMDDFRDQHADGPVRGAYYTVRRWRPDEGELDLWAVVHDHPGSVAAWMAQARPGDALALWGPRRGFVPPSGIHHLLTVADETGAAAVCALIDQLPHDVAVTAVLETVDDRHHLPLPPHPGLQVHWVHRGSEEPGRTNRLLPAVRAAIADAPDAAFGGAESRQISAVRRYLRDELAMPAPCLLMTGYWRARS